MKNLRDATRAHLTTLLDALEVWDASTLAPGRAIADHAHYVERRVQINDGKSLLRELLASSRDADMKRINRLLADARRKLTRKAERLTAQGHEDAADVVVAILAALS